MHILKKKNYNNSHIAILDLGALNNSKSFVSGLNEKHSQEDTIDSAWFLFLKNEYSGFSSS